MRVEHAVLAEQPADARQEVVGNIIETLDSIMVLENRLNAQLNKWLRSASDYAIESLALRVALPLGRSRLVGLLFRC